MAENILHSTKVKNAGSSLLGDGGGLYLKKQRTDTGQWIFRYTLTKKRIEMGLGGWPAVSLAEARGLRNKWRSHLKTTGKDPRAERDRIRREDEIAKGSTLSDLTDEKFESVRVGLKGKTNAKRWRSPLDIHLLPRLGHVPISEITQHDIASAVKPIWRTKAVTARKITNRLSLIFDHAEAKGLPVSRQTVRAAKNLLGEQGHKVQKIPAMNWRDVPQYYKNLRDSPSELALKLMILTALRSKPIRHAHIDQIEGNLWTIPAELMKGKKGLSEDFEVPLTEEAIAVIERAKVHERDGYLFPGQRKGVISDMTLSQFMKRQGLEARPHGFRSSFRTWVAETTETPRDVAEAALSHAIGSQVERTYQRSTMLDRRRVLMEKWMNFVIESHSNIIRIKSQ